MPIPTQQDLQNRIGSAINWLIPLIRQAPATTPNYSPDPNEEVIKMYNSCPAILDIPGAAPLFNNECERTRGVGHEFAREGAGVLEYARLYLHERSFDRCGYWVEFVNWPDGQPSLWFFYWRVYDVSGWVWHGWYYYGKPSGDTRTYGIECRFDGQLVMSDHRTQPAGYLVSEWKWREQSKPSNKYFVRTENLPASKVLIGYWNRDKLFNFNTNYWGYFEQNFDIYNSSYAMGKMYVDDYLYAYDQFMYADCEPGMINYGCPAPWHYDEQWGFSHRSKVCQWVGGYNWVTRQDPLVMIPQAIHILNKYGDPDHQYNSPWPNDPWPKSAPNPGDPLTPRQLARWVEANFWNGNGIHLYKVPVLGDLFGTDKQSSSLRTDLFCLLETLLGFRYGDVTSQGWANTAISVLAQTQVGFPPWPDNQLDTVDQGMIRRNIYQGAQVFMWEKQSPLKMGSFGDLRSLINETFDQPADEEDYIVSTVETTQIFAQAMRVYLYHQYGVTHGEGSTIPGHPYAP